MPSSTVDFYLTRNGIIDSALRLLTVTGIDESPTSGEYTICARYLNMMIKFWQTSGINLMSRREAFLFLSPNTTSYSLSNTGAHCTETYYTTTISTAEASGQTTLSVTSTADMTVNDYIGIELDDGTLFWSTISSKTSTTVTIADAITDDAAAGNVVINYTTKIDRPLEIFYGYRRDLTTTSPSDSAMTIMAEMDYARLNNKEQTGYPNQFVYNPYKDAGILKIWQVPERFQFAFGFSYLKMVSDYDLATDTSEFPNEWILPLVYNLAYYIAPVYGKWQEQSLLANKAKELYERVVSFNQENASIKLATIYDSTPRDY